ncbi:unnamed protein product [Spirodela intermedia]|uniref:Uncharacterized protein n=1 Tax=Spirodela intermedia TaxID=51605 RepID=A0A7I8ITV4_SPIIN|nr:unnamed protein product [Spirodela intermedia]CAA6661236.1 unnamed protein product [Spirodela intermedia]
MEEGERRALYSAIQGFVGRNWNGSELFRTPAGVSCDLFDGRWYVTTMSIGPILENSLQCAADADFSPPLFDPKYLKSLTFFKCFSPPQRRHRRPLHELENLAGTLETLEFRSNPGLSGDLLPISAASAAFGCWSWWRTGLSASSGQLAGLTHRNALVGPLPSSMSGSALFLKLDLSYNLLSGKIPPELPGEFLQRMGRGFSAWGNPNLCYSAATILSPATLQQAEAVQGGGGCRRRRQTCRKSNSSGGDGDRYSSEAAVRRHQPTSVGDDDPAQPGGHLSLPGLPS